MGELRHDVLARVANEDGVDRAALLVHVLVASLLAHHGHAELGEGEAEGVAAGAGHVDKRHGHSLARGEVDHLREIAAVVARDDRHRAGQGEHRDAHHRAESVSLGPEVLATRGSRARGPILGGTQGLRLVGRGVFDVVHVV